jgi:hypothetical protein
MADLGDINVGGHELDAVGRAAGVDAQHLALVIEHGAAAVAGIGRQLGFADDGIDLMAGVFVSEFLLIDGPQGARAVIPHGAAGRWIADQVKVVARLAAVGHHAHGRRALRKRLYLNKAEVAPGIDTHNLAFDARRCFEVIVAFLDKPAVLISGENNLDLFLGGHHMLAG